MQCTHKQQSAVIVFSCIRINVCFFEDTRTTSGTTYDCKGPTVWVFSVMILVSTTHLTSLLPRSRGAKRDNTSSHGCGRSTSSFSAFMFQSLLAKLETNRDFKGRSSPKEKTRDLWLTISGNLPKGQCKTPFFFHSRWNSLVRARAITSVVNIDFSGKFFLLLYYHKTQHTKQYYIWTCIHTGKKYQPFCYCL